MRAVVITEFGGADRLTLVEREAPSAQAGQLVVEVAAAGVNYMDVYQRMGVGPFIPQLPFVTGNEGAGTVVEVGDEVTDFALGDRVAWSGVPGGYAERVVIPAARALPVPEGLELELAASALLQGMTAHYLATSVFPVQPGQVAVVHAAAGGVGQLLTQIIALRGGTVIATTSTSEKAELARAAGAAHVAGYDDFGATVTEVTEGRGAHVVFDGVGATTFDAGLESLGVRGTFVLFGASSGPVPPVDPMRLAPKSAMLTRPSLPHFVATRDELVARSSELFGWIADGSLQVRIGHRYPLADAAEAHRDLEGRRTTGKLLLVP